VISPKDAMSFHPNDEENSRAGIQNHPTIIVIEHSNAIPENELHVARVE
jgi:hypothetical protein